MWQCQVCLIYFSVFLVIVTCFNVDSFNYAMYTGPDTSMFGFSLTFHKQSGRGWLIVGAPEAQSSNQRNVTRGGVVFKCPTDRDGSCEEIPFDRQAQQLNSENQPYDNKTGQWFGATVSGSGRENGRIVACAPRYTWYPKKRNRRDPVGTCWVMDGHFANSNEYSPCRTSQWGYHRQGSCQAGFSVAINSIGDRLFIGAPGSWYWQGQMYSIDALAWFEFRPRFGTYGAEGQVHQQSLDVRPSVFSTEEGSEKDDVSYMGYSTIVGDFIGDGEEEEGIAVGMPRGNELKGKVLLLAWNLTDLHHHFSSDQIGSYYGYALAASDVDGDKKIDLIIGAPMYTLPNSEHKYDVGRVYVIYHNSKMGKFVATYVIDGFKSKSRFGQALSTLGDINQDGYGDFAVGAPYDGSDERGAVYIYHGSSKGVRKKYSQVIYAEDVVKKPPGSLNSFGFSITGGMDLDGNDYPDMAVGAYSTNNAFYFRSRPVVLIDAKVNFLTPRKEIDLKKGNYTLQNGETATITSIDFCIKYHGKGIPKYIDLGLQYTLDLKKPKSSRMGFVGNESKSIFNDTIIGLEKDSQEICRNKMVFVKSDIRDKLTPLVAEVKYWMLDDSRYYQNGRNPRSILRPVLDLDSPPSRKDSISVHKDCGDDNICIPDLNLSVKSNVDEYLLDSTENLTFDVIVSNKGEDSFETILEVKYPLTVFYSYKVDKLETQVLCNTYENNTLRCELGNPIPKNKVVRFSIIWQPSTKDGMDPTYEFDLYVNSTNQELNDTLKDNFVHVSVGIWSNSTLDITGESHPAKVHFNASSYKADISKMHQNIPFKYRLEEGEIGPQVIHVYHLRNEGPTTITETEVFFVWPARTLGGQDFLYLLEPPQFLPNENVHCDSIVANHLNFNTVRNKTSIWKWLQLESAETYSVNRSDSKIGSTIGGGISKNDSALNRKVQSSADGSFINQQRYQSGSQQNADHENIVSTGSRHSGASQTVTHTSTKHYKKQNGVTQITEQNRTELTNGTGSFVKHDSTGNLEHGLQNAGINHINTPSYKVSPTNYNYDNNRNIELSGNYITHGGYDQHGENFGVTTLDLGNFGEERFAASTERNNRQSHWQHYENNVERDNVPTDRPVKRQRFYGRKKRQLMLPYNPYPEISNRFPCTGVQCDYMRCVVSSLEKDKPVTIALRSRINARVLRNVTTTQPTTFSSVMAARISKLPFIGQPLEQQLYFYEIVSTIPPQESESKADVVPLWVVVLSAVAGTIILLLLVFLLYKAGFFKRNRPSNAPERQPLNRNGYNHGDEAL